MEKNDLFLKTINCIKEPDYSIKEESRHKIDFKTKPVGSLGKLEDLALQMCLIQNDLNPRIDKKLLLVFAGDHGIAYEGVSAFPSEVTSQMVYNFLNGGAAINVLCRYYGIDISVIDIGVNHNFENAHELIDKKIRKGTRNFAVEEAMTEDEALRSIEAGMDVFFNNYNKSKVDILGLGEMGIANTTSASAIISTVTGISVENATGRGTGINDDIFKHKINLIKKACGIHKPDPKDGIDILKKIGGYEIAGIAGAVLAAASKKTAVVLDGVISTAGGLIAYLIKPEIKDYLFSGHKSVEIGQKSALDFMGIDAIIDFNMRLGEGTGAAISMNIIDAACHIMREMASFEEAGVSNKD